MKASRINATAVLLAITSLGLSGCATSDIYPQMPENSSFERHITTVWGQTHVIYKRGPQAPETSSAK